MRTIYLSPHFDDAVLSCGGIIWQQAHSGQRVEIWTLCAGYPPADGLTPFAAGLHARWGAGASPVAERRAEDAAACRAVGAALRHFDMPDCIYRRLADGSPLINGEADLWVERLDERTAPDVEKARAWLASTLPARCRLVVPLTLGGHIDHHIARAAAEALNRPLWYYADYPYVASHQINVRAWLGPGWRRRQYPVSPPALAAWQAGIAAYRSQLSSFWRSPEQMRAAMAQYLADGGNALWRRLPATGMG